MKASIAIATFREADLPGLGNQAAIVGLLVYDSLRWS